MRVKTPQIITKRPRKIRKRDRYTGMISIRLHRILGKTEIADYVLFKIRPVPNILEKLN